MGRAPLPEQHHWTAVGDDLGLSRLIFSGTRDRNPGMRLLAAHGGGYLRMYGGRSNHAERVRPEAGVMCKRPTDYLKDIYFDSLVYEPLASRQLIDNVGVDRVQLGTDYTYDMGEAPPKHSLLFCPVRKRWSALCPRGQRQAPPQTLTDTALAQ